MYLMCTLILYCVPSTNMEEAGFRWQSRGFGFTYAAVWNMAVKRTPFEEVQLVVSKAFTQHSGWIRTVVITERIWTETDAAAHPYTGTHYPLMRLTYDNDLITTEPSPWQLSYTVTWGETAGCVWKLWINQLHLMNIEIQQLTLNSLTSSSSLSSR